MNRKIVRLYLLGILLTIPVEFVFNGFHLLLKSSLMSVASATFAFCIVYLIDKEIKKRPVQARRKM